jgi:uncharacterized protein
VTRRLRLETADGHELCECAIADTVLARMRGLLGRRGLGAGEGLLISPAPSVHTCGMRFPIDVVFLDRGLRVLDVRAALRPWRFAAHRGARSVLELPAGRAAEAGLRPGDRLREAQAARPCACA